MILIVTFCDDYTADHVVAHMNDKGVAYYRLNTDIFFNYTHRLSDDEDQLHLSEYSGFRSVWFRRVHLPTFPNTEHTEAHYLSLEYKQFLSNLWATIPGHWVSPPLSIQAAENKLLQLRVAREIGLSIPNTLVSPSPQTIINFYHQNHGEVIVKPIYHNRLQTKQGAASIFTTRLLPEHILRLNESAPFPTLVQKYIKKDYEIRVTVIGNNVFAARVDSQSLPETSVDWRKKRLPFTIEKLPDSIADKCLSLTHKFNLRFGAIDLIRTPDGQFVFLEINPNGQWAWIEFDTGLPLAETLTKELLC